MTPPPAAAGTVAPRPAHYPRRRPHAPPRPRRVSGPARPARSARGVQRPRHDAPAADGLVLGLAGALGKLASHRLLDRLIAGKAWIALVAFALIGIVTLQLGLLELNRGIGRTLEREQLLERENAALSVENSELAAGNRVESSAQQLGMEIVPSASLRFLSSDPASDVAKAAAALNQPVHSVTVGSSPSGGAGAPEASSSSNGSSAPGAGAGASEASGTPSASSAPGAGAGGSEASGAPSASSASSASAGGSEASGSPSGESAVTTSATTSTTQPREATSAASGG